MGKRSRRQVDEAVSLAKQRAAGASDLPERPGRWITDPIAGRQRFVPAPIGGGDTAETPFTGYGAGPH